MSKAIPPAEAVDIRRVVTGSLSANCYVASSPSRDAAIVDPGGDLDSIVEYLTANRLRVHAVLATHAHHDHVAAAADLVERYEVPFYLHPADERLLSRANFVRTLVLGWRAIRIPGVDCALAGETTLRFGDLGVDVVHTPGHTPGGVTFAVGGDLLTGDTLLVEGLGRTDFPEGDRTALEASVSLLARRYPPGTTLRPGHGEPGALGDVLSLLASAPGSDR